MAHYTYKDYIFAHRLYREMLECAAFSADEKAEIATQLAATYLELVGSGRKGHPEDVRRACELLMRGVPERYARERATIDLIRSETWFYEPADLEQAIASARVIQNSYRHIPHIAAQAAYNEMVALDRAGQRQAAIRVGIRIADMPFDVSQSFSARLAGRLDIRARAAGIVAGLAGLEMDSDTSQRYSALRRLLERQHRSVVTQYPGYGVF
jgi:hypothetical protein